MQFKSLVLIAVLATAVLCFGIIIPASAQTSSTWCHTFNTNLGYANSGSKEVGYLHAALEMQKISYSPDTGNKYSNGTTTGVVKFQKKYGISQTGYVGDATRKQLNKLYGCASTPSIAVTSPNGAESWAIGETHNITWTSGNLGSASVIIVLQSSSGTLIMVSNVPASAGKYSWIVPSNLPVGNYKISVYSKSPAVSDTSDGYFSITAPAPTCTSFIYSAWDTCMNGYQKRTIISSSPMGCTGGSPIISQACTSTPIITVTSPNGGETWKIGETHDITWTSLNAPSGGFTVGISLIGTSSGTSAIIAQEIPLSIGHYSWTVPSNLVVGNQYKILIGTGGLRDDSDNYFSIASSGAPSITVTSPNGANGGEQWQLGTTQTITWTATGLTNVGLHVQSFPSGMVYVIDGAPASPGSYLWHVGKLQDGTTISAGTSYKIYINGGSANWQTYDTSDYYFNIVAQAVGLNISQSQLASISNALAKIAQMLKALMGQ